MSKLRPKGDFIVGPDEIEKQPEGLTRLQYRPSPQLEEYVHDQVTRGLKKMTNRGGRGQDGVDRIGAAVLTVKETVAVAIAKDMVDDAVRRHKRPLENLTFLELVEGSDQRVRHRGCTQADVMAELARLQNKAIYGDEVRRR